jgi:hypothetical protein
VVVLNMWKWREAFQCQRRLIDDTNSDVVDYGHV